MGGEKKPGGKKKPVEAAFLANNIQASLGRKKTNPNTHCWGECKLSTIILEDCMKEIPQKSEN